MTVQGWPYVQDPREYRIRIIIIVSFLLHLAGVGTCLIYPFIFKKKSVSVPVLTIVQLEKPKIRLRRPKTIQKAVEKKPIMIIPKEMFIELNSPSSRSKPSEVSWFCIIALFSR